MAWVLANASTLASAGVAALGVGDQVLDDVDVAADVEDAAGVGPDQGRRGVSGLASSSFLSLGGGGWMMWSVSPLNDSVETLAPASSACLVLRFRTSVILLGVLAGVGHDRQGDRQLGVVLGDGGDRQGALGQLEQLLEGDADLLLEGLAGVLQLGRQVFAEVLERRVVPELAVLALAERLAKRVDVVDLEQEDGGVGEDLFRGCRGLGEVRTSVRKDRDSPSHPTRARRRIARFAVRIT